MVTKYDQDGTRLRAARRSADAGVSMIRIAACCLLLLAAVNAPGIARAAACREEIGPARARVLVERCIEVSPATHPPCNASNACSLIVGEIRRGCLMFKNSGGMPEWCGTYTQ